MLAYNDYRKHKSDPVREILAKLDAKQFKTGLSLYKPHHHNPSRNLTPLEMTGGSPKLQGAFFPDLKAAREKAQNRITAADLSKQDAYSVSRQTRTKRIPHRLPGVNINQTFPPSTHGVDKLDDRMSNRMNQTYSIPGSQFDRDRIDININPFGYNRKTLAFDQRNINYVVEWPETWPFKITSFQGKSKQTKKKPKRIHLPPDAVPFPPPFSCDDRPALPWREPTNPQTRILAPVDHPSKQPVFPTKPYVESAVRRGSRRVYPKGEFRKSVILRSQEREFDFNSRSGDEWRRDDIDSTHSDKQMELNSPDGQEGSDIQNPNIEREDSGPPSTPVADDEHKEKHEKETEDDVQQEAKEVLNDIVNQIIKDDRPQI